MNNAFNNLVDIERFYNEYKDTFRGGLGNSIITSFHTSNKKEAMCSGSASSSTIDAWGGTTVRELNERLLRANGIFINEEEDEDEEEYTGLETIITLYSILDVVEELDKKGTFFLIRRVEIEDVDALMEALSIYPFENRECVYIDNKEVTLYLSWKDIREQKKEKYNIKELIAELLIIFTSFLAMAAPFFSPNSAIGFKYTTVLSITIGALIFIAYMIITEIEREESE